MEKERYNMLYRAVVKLGTGNLSSEVRVGSRTEKRLDQHRFSDVARQVVEVQKRYGIEIAIVTSGAIRAGEERIKELGGNPADYPKEDLAATGARHLLNRWGDAFEPYKKDVEQIWITHQNWENLKERESIKLRILNSFKDELFIPLINENDPVANLEIRLMEKGISENDYLAMKIAFLIQADAILLLTDEGGVYEEDPKRNSEARLFEEINAWALPKELVNISRDISGGGRGGMKTKLEAAYECAREGMQVAIAGRENNVIIEFVKGEPVGTRIGKTTKFKVC